VTCDVRNNEVFGNVKKRKKVLPDGIRELDILEEGRGLNKEERRSKDELSSELERLLLCEEVSWRQKSRALWLRMGDKNTIFTGWQTQIEGTMPLSL
jgi:hypothetical protein